MDDNNIKDQNSNIKDESETQSVEKAEVKVDEDSRLSETGEVSSESTSSDVHEPDQVGSEQSEEVELENQDQPSEGEKLNEAEEKTDEASQPDESGDPSAAPQDDNKNTPDDQKKDNPNARWYVVHTYSGHENKVAHTLKQRIESEHLGEKILDVLVPMQEKIEIKGGKKVNIKEKIFPGYILVKMVLDDISWLAVRTTQGVTSFVGMGNKPTPISDAEVATIVKFTQSEAPMYKQVFMANDTVKIVDGPFADFIGKIDSVDEEKGKVRVLVSIFGRETPVELDFLQIKKI